MSLLLRSGWATLGLLALAGLAPAQSNTQVIQAPVEVTSPGEGRIRFPFFRLFASSQPTSVPTSATTIAQTAEPPLAGSVEENPPAGAAAAPSPPSAVRPLATARPPIDTPNHTEFANRFTPMPGQYREVILHPFTGQPVTVNFQLPPTRGVYKTQVTRRTIEFDSPDHTVDIRFTRDGRVGVNED